MNIQNSINRTISMYYLSYSLYVYIHYISLSYMLYSIFSMLVKFAKFAKLQLVYTTYIQVLYITSNHEYTICIYYIRLAKLQIFANCLYDNVLIFLLIAHFLQSCKLCKLTILQFCKICKTWILHFCKLQHL